MENAGGQEPGIVVQYMDYEVVVRYDNGGIVLRHVSVDCSESDYFSVCEIACDKAKEGCEVFILPVLIEGDLLRDSIFSGAKENKCPDLKVDGIYMEVKTPTANLHETKISTNIKRGHEQADYVVILLVEHFSSGKLYNIAKGRFKTHDTLQIIEFKMSGKYYRYERWKVYKKNK